MLEKHCKDSVLAVSPFVSTVGNIIAGYLAESQGVVCHCPSPFDIMVFFPNPLSPPFITFSLSAPIFVRFLTRFRLRGSFYSRPNHQVDQSSLSWAIVFLHRIILSPHPTSDVTQAVMCPRSTTFLKTDHSPP